MPGLSRGSPEWPGSSGGSYSRFRGLAACGASAEFSTWHERWRGGRTAAILASLTSTCRRHDIDPQIYLTQLLVNLPALHIRDLPDWLPDRWKATQKIRQDALQSQTPLP